VKRRFNILVIGSICGPIYLILALAGDLREHWLLFYPTFLLLWGLTLTAWFLQRGRPLPMRWVLAFALLFRLVAPWGEPSLSDDVYRYVWDGRVQAAGHHPYRYAPDAPELADLRDEDWERINHREIKTVYPPLAQMVFAALAKVGLGPLGFRLMFGGVDFLAVLLLCGLIRRLRAPPERLLLYAWNPLAILEGAGSGHLDVLGGWFAMLFIVSIFDGKRARGTAALVAGVGVKLLPLVWLLSLIRRVRPRHLGIGLLLAVVIAVPYAATGPTIPDGTRVYAERWQGNGPVFEMLLAAYGAVDLTETLKTGIADLQIRIGDRADVTSLYQRVYPQDLARLTLVIAGVAWILLCVRRRSGSLVDELYTIVLGVMLLQPTIHPWYLIWLLPLAAARADWPVLLWAMLIPLVYRNATGSPENWVLLVEYLPPVVLAVMLTYYRRRVRPPRADIMPPP